MLANLANFAYDPSNMEALQMLQVSELFLDTLTEENENFVEFGIGKLKSDLVLDNLLYFYENYTEFLVRMNTNTVIWCLTEVTNLQVFWLVYVHFIEKYVIPCIISILFNTFCIKICINIYLL